MSLVDRAQESTDRAGPGGHAKLRAFIGLGSAFALGQGALFLVQSHLMLTGQPEEVAWFGVRYLIATLLLQIIDFGGQSMLAAYAVNGNDADLRTFFWSLSLGRLMLAAALIASAALAAYQIPQVRSVCLFTLAISPGLVAQAVNPAGIIEGLGRAQWNGIAAALPPLAGGLALLVCGGAPDHTRSVLVGGAIGVAAVLGVAIQMRVAASLKPGAFGVPDRSELRLQASMTDGAHALLVLIPGQLVYRAQVFAASLLGATLLGAFIYAKQAWSVAAQMGWFLRRAEFPQFAGDWLKSRSIWPVARRSISLRLVACSSVACIALGAAIAAAGPHSLRTSGMVLALFAPALLSAGALAFVLQAFVLERIQARAAPTILVGSTLIALIPMATASRAGIWGIALAELSIQIVQLVVLLGILKTNTAHPAPRRT